MKIGEVHIIQRDNPYHEWRVREAVIENNLKIKRENWIERDLRRYRYSGLMDEREVLWLQVGRMTTSMKKVLQSIKLRRRLVIFEVGNNEERKWLQGFEIDGESAKTLPAIRSWQEKEHECLKMLASYRAVFESAEVRKRLIGLMIRDPESWSDVKLGVEISKRKGDPISLGFLQDMFPNMEFYRVDDWVRGVIHGNLKQKSLRIAYYFRHERGYSNVWLMNRLREKVKDIGLVYEAYRRGILYGEISKSKIRERSKVMEWEGGDKLSEMKPVDMRWCLRVIEGLPYKYFVEVQKVLFTGAKVVDKDWDIYRYIEELRQRRGEHDVGKGANN